jgi:hypothetical protein
VLNRIGKRPPGDGVVEIIDQAIHATGWFVGGKA